MILSVTLNPSVDHALFVDELKIGDTNRVKRTERDAGGKGVNLSRVVAELGAPTLATGFVGGGPGDYVKGVLTRQGVSHCFIDVADDTRINFSVEDNSLRCPTTFNERGPNIRPEELEELMAKLADLLSTDRPACPDEASRVSWMCVGGSLPPGVPNDIFRRIIELGHEHGARVALDADGEPLKFGIEAKPDFLKPNSKECMRLLNREVATVDDAARAAFEIRSHLAESAIVVVSLGENGAVMASREGLMRGVTPKVEVRSTIGSGDSLIAGVLWAIEEGKPLDEAFRWGLACGAATATTDGSEIARKDKILELMPEARVERVVGLD